MTPLDLGTVILLHKTSLLAGSATLLLVWFRTERPPAVAMIAAALGWLAVGAILAGLGETRLIPTAVWRDTSMAIAVGAYTLLWLGMRRLDRRVGALRWFGLLTPFALAIGIWTELFSHNETRALAFHVTAGLGSLLGGLSLCAHRRAEPLPSRCPLAVALFACAAIYGAQIPLLALGLATPTTLAQGFALTMMLHFAISALVVSFVRERREERYRRVSLTDALTGTLNRQGFHAQVPAHLPNGSALAVFDLDLFKAINDRYGHPGGDRVLIAFARVIERCVRPGEIVARIGGEEFVLYVPPEAARHALARVEDIRVSLMETGVNWKGETIFVSTSVGLAHCETADGISRETLFAMADEALYRAKQHGRNRVAQAGTVANDTPPQARAA
ncbi:GGDEF domain-containing protein [Aureimonas ureilytica]|uniref:GGDEF domain-containing protein n=1 Tax=Aureimonas ureilytica TaxID=401562 RepID=UPI00035EFCAB|nr:GGDEF domain-containing protein [Aureimonas ureilytica]